MSTILGVPKIRVTVFWGLCWGPPILEYYHSSFNVDHPYNPYVIVTNKATKSNFYRAPKPTLLGEMLDFG